MLGYGRVSLFQMSNNLNRNRCLEIVGAAEASSSLVESGGRGLVSTHSCLQFWIFNRQWPEKNLNFWHRLFWDFRADKTFSTRWSGGRVQVWVQVWAPAGHLTIIITPEGYSRRKSKGLNAKSMAVLLGQRSGTAWAASSSTGHLQVGRSRWGQGLLEENVLPLLLYWLIWRSKRFCFVNFGLWQVTFFSMSNEILYGIGEKLFPTKAQPIASFNLLIIHLSLIKNWA